VLSTAERQKYAILSSHKMAIHHILAMAVVKNLHRSLPWPIIDSTVFPQSPPILHSIINTYGGGRLRDLTCEICEEMIILREKKQLPYNQ
jgi:hypothetical protein